MTYNQDTLIQPTFITYDNMISLSYVVQNSSGNFFRTNANSNIELIVPLGVDILSDNIYTSPDIYLPLNTFNSVKDNDIVKFPSNKDVNILDDVTCLHDIFIQYKIAKSDDNNFLNQREIIATLVKADGTTIYSNSIISHRQPDTSAHDDIVFKGNISHSYNDIVKIKFNIIQDERLSGHSNSKLTIFYVAWNILVSKN